MPCLIPQYLEDKLHVHEREWALQLRYDKTFRCVTRHLLRLFWADRVLFILCWKRVQPLEVTRFLDLSKSKSPLRKLKYSFYRSENWKKVSSHRLTSSSHDRRRILPLSFNYSWSFHKGINICCYLVWDSLQHTRQDVKPLYVRIIESPQTYLLSLPHNHVVRANNAFYMSLNT